MKFLYALVVSIVFLPQFSLAHNTFGDTNGFYNGISHGFLVLEHALFLCSVFLMFARHTSAIRMGLPMVAGGIFMGICFSFLNQTPPTELWVIAGALLNFAMVFFPSQKISLWGYRAWGVGLGISAFFLGWQTDGFFEITGGIQKLFFLGGMMLPVLIFASWAMFLRSRFKKFPLFFRGIFVLASWGIAIGVLAVVAMAR